MRELLLFVYYRFDFFWHTGVFLSKKEMYLSRVDRVTQIFDTSKPHQNPEKAVQPIEPVASSQFLGLSPSGRTAVWYPEAEQEEKLPKDYSSLVEENPLSVRSVEILDTNSSLNSTDVTSSSQALLAGICMAEVFLNVPEEVLIKTEEGYKADILSLKEISFHIAAKISLERDNGRVITDDAIKQISTSVFYSAKLKV